MPNETIEILTRFVTEGRAELDRVESILAKVSGSSASASKSVQKVGADLGTAGKAAKETGRDFNQLADSVESGLIDPLNTATSTLRSFVMGLGPVGAAVGVAAVGFGILGKQAFDLVSAQGAAAEATLNLADRLGIAAGEAEQLQVQAEIAGVNVGSLESSAKLLSVALEDSGGAGAKTVAALRSLGVATHAASGEQLELGKVFLGMLEKLGAVKSDSERVALAIKTLGKSAIDVIPMIKNFEELQETTRKLKIGLDENLYKTLTSADDEIGKMRASWAQFKKELAAQIAPIVIPVVGQITNLLNGSGEPAGPRTGKSFTPGVDFLRRQGLDVGSDPSMKQTFDLIRSFAPASAPEVDRVATQYKSRLSATPRGIQQQIADLQKSLQEQESIIFGTGAAASAKSNAVTEAQRIEKEIAKLEASLKSLQQKPADITGQIEKLIFSYAKSALSELEAFDAQLNSQIQELAKAGATPAQTGSVRAAAAGPRGEILSRELNAITGRTRGAALSGSLLGQLSNVLAPYQGSLMVEGGDDKAGQDQLKAYAAAILEQEKRRIDEAAKRTDMEVQAAIRLLELSDDEYDSAVRIRDIKLSTAKDAVEARQADLDYAIRIEEIEKRRTERYRETAGRVFDSLTASGGGGLGDLLRGQFKILERQLFVNASSGLFEQFGGAFGQIGAKSGLGGLLKGTIFDPQNARDPNTRALERNTKSLDRLTGTVSGSGLLGMPGGLDGIFGLGGMPGIIDEKGFGTRKGSNPLSFLTNLFQSKQSFDELSMITTGTKNLDLASAIYGVPLKTGPGMSGLAKGVGIAGLGAGAAFGAYSGFSAGGVQGALTGSSSILGGVAGMLPLLGATGPAAPIIGGIALAAGAIAALIGDPKKRFAEDQQTVLKGNRYSGPESEERTYDYATGATARDMDYKGRTRVNYNVTINVDAMDAQSFERRASDIANVVGRAIRDGHPIRQDIDEAVLGKG